MLEATDDRALVEALRRGEESAFLTLLERYQSALVRSRAGREAQTNSFSKSAATAGLGSEAVVPPYVDVQH
jgi:hypothetical protein